MKKLREIITESLKYKTTYQDTHNLEHSATVGPHVLAINHSYDSDRGVLGSNFTLDGSYYTDEHKLASIPQHHKNAILTTVKNSTIEAIQRFKPKAYEWYTPSPGKMRLYNMFAKHHIQKKFGGKIVQKDHSTASVNFTEKD